MKIKTWTAGALLAASAGAFAIGDPGFERTEPQELPLWSGAQWAKASTAKYTAKIVEDPREAAEGKRFLRVENPNKTSVYVMAYPSIKRIPGYGMKLSCKARGTGLQCFGFTPYGSNGKVRPWKAKQSTRFKRMTPDKWESFELEYIPEEGDVSFLASLSIRDGRVDFDDFKFEMFRVDEAASPKPAEKKAQAPVQKKNKLTPLASGKDPLVIFSDFETWRNGLPQGWKRHEDDGVSVIRRALHSAGNPGEYGRSGLFLNGKIIMDPPMKGLAVPRSRPMRLVFYARGENGRVRARLHEGRNGFVDYLVDLVDEPTTSEWKKYATAFSLPPACRIDNAAVELIGENVIVDNVEFKAARGGDGKLVYSIPVVKTAPVIDGKVSPGEWDCATGASDPLQLANFISGQFKPESPALSQQNTVRFCSDGKKLYFLFEVPEGAGLKRDFTRRDDRIYMDDAVELHINPEFGNVAPRYSYQFVFNANNAVFDQRREKGGGNVDFYKWNSSTIENKSRISDGVWTLEGSVDLAEIGVSPDKPFGLNVCAAKRNPDEAGSLNGGTFLGLGFMVRAVVDTARPGLYWSKNGDWGSLLVTVSGGTSPAANYTVTYTIDSEKAAVKQKKTIRSTPGNSVPVLFNVPGGAGKFGTMTLTMTDEKGNVAFRQTMDFNSGIKPVREVRKDLEFHHLPEQKKYAVNIHRRGGWADKVDRVEVYGVSEKPVTYKIADFADFIETLVVKAPFTPVDGKKYTVTLLALDKNGSVLAGETVKFTADASLVPRDHSADFKGVLPLYTPIEARENEAKVQFRTYTFAGNGLPGRITALGREVLHGPVKFVAEDASGKLLAGEDGKFEVVASSPEELVFRGKTVFPGFTLELDGRMEYDGAIFYKARVSAPAPVELKRLSIEIPLNELDYFQTYVEDQLRLWMCRQPKSGEYRHPSVPVWKPGTILHPQSYRRFMLLFFPEGDGLLWDSRDIVPGVIKNGFLPYMTVGNHKFGFEFFSDTDRGWVHNRKSAIHEILRRNGKEVVRTNFIAMPWKLEDGRTFEFGLLATPARERCRGYRDGYINGYSHTGLTDQALAGLRVKDWKLYSAQIDRLKNARPIQLCCKGHFPQMDPVAVYLDSEWRRWPKYFFRDSYASVSGRVFGTDQRYYFSPAGCYTPGRIDFYADRFEDFAKNAPALQGFYWDENWNKPCSNPNHADCGHILADGQLQGRVWWTGVREVDRRAQHIFRKYGRKDPLLTGFTGEGLIPHAHAFVSINLLGEHFTYDMDFIDYWTPHFTEIAYAGAWGFDVGGFGMFRDPKYLAKIHLNRAQLALFKLYDAHFLPANFNRAVYRPVEAAEKRFGKAEKDVVFAGYFMDEGKRAVTGLPFDVKASLFIRPGRGALVHIANLGEKDAAVKPGFHLGEWKINSFSAFNAETQKPVDLNGKLTVKKHDFLMLELKAR
ncbi:MAG: hypothetical protein IJU70_11830 [Lentisphaeria bacterium]|nr:hypothetical protein [Lentisphaeria bacterium]